MTESKNIFQLKQREQQQSTSEQKILAELRVDEQKVKAISKNIKGIFSGDIGNQEILEAIFVQRKFSQPGENGYLQGDNGNVLRKKNADAFFRGDIADQKVSDPEQQQLLLRIFTERRSSLIEVRSSMSMRVALEKNLEQILSGDIQSIEVLEALFSQRKFSQPGDNGYLQGDNGNIVRKKNGDAFFRGDIADQKVSDSEQQQLLLDQLKDKTNFLIKRDKSFKEQIAVKKNLGQILSGDIQSIEILEAIFVQNKFSQPGGSGYLQGDNGNIVRKKNGDAFFRGDIADQKVDDPQRRELLRDLFSILRSETIPNEQRLLIRKYLESEDETAFERLKLLLDTEANSTQRDNILDVINKYESFIRLNNLQQEFFKALVNPAQGFPVALELLTVYESKEKNDLDELVKLREIAFDRRRIQVTREFLNILKDENNIDLALNLLRQLTEGEKDAEVRRVLAKLVYKLELSGLKVKVAQQFAFDADENIKIEDLISSIPIRPTVDDIDYVDTLIELKNTGESITSEVRKFRQLDRACRIRRMFEKADSKVILQLIEMFSVETVEDGILQLELFDLYKKYVAASRPNDFDKIFADELKQRIISNLEQQFVSPELGRNADALRYVRDRFRESLFPLIENLRKDPQTEAVAERILTVQVDGEQIDNPRKKYKQIPSELEKQRELSKREKEYLDSVTALSGFNPYLISAAEADFGVTSEFLRHHFERLSRETVDELQDGKYVPFLIIGTGPGGLTALGELARNNPSLASKTLVIDQGERIGGPFAVPKGPAWELNSANRRGEGGYSLPDPQENGLETVRAYGSPVARWYPGERARGNDIRKGSINTSVDYLIAPDELSAKRYPTNEQLQFILEQQAALLVKKIALRTELESVEPNTEGEKGDKIATLVIRDNNGGVMKRVRIRFDGAIVASGLGEAGYGFQFEGSKAQRVVDQTKDQDAFPKISTTLDAFRALADRTKEKKSPGKTIVIWGKGNSADTLIENIGALFQSENPLVRDVTKIYVIADGDLSKRPRYALLNDIKPRNGRGNLIEFINARVADTDFATTEGEPQDRELAFFDPTGKEIVDSQGKAVRGDSGIAATGFQPSLDKVFKSYLKPGQSFRPGGDNPTEALSLPTNGKVAVADQLIDDPNILFVETASQPRFSLEKLAQLPREARNALLRNGVENAVAIGFRAPDTQAALNIWLNKRNIDLSDVSLATQEKLHTVEVNGSLSKDEEITKIPVSPDIDPTKLGIPNNVENTALFLSSILSYELGSQSEFIGGGSQELDFSVNYDSGSNQFLLKYEGSVSDHSISSQFLEVVKRVIENEDFQKYAIKSLQKIRSNRRNVPELNIVIGFKNGKLNPKNTFVQVGFARMT